MKSAVEILAEAMQEMRSNGVRVHSWPPALVSKRLRDRAWTALRGLEECLSYRLITTEETARIKRRLARIQKVYDKAEKAWKEWTS